MSGSDSTHFNTEVAGTPDAPGRYVKVDEIEPVQFVAGLGFQPSFALGRLMGYPDCCVAAFAAQPDRSNNSRNQPKRRLLQRPRSQALHQRRRHLHSPDRIPDVP